MKDGVEIEFPDDDAYTQALFKLDIQGSSTREIMVKLRFKFSK